MENYKIVLSPKEIPLRHSDFENESIKNPLTITTSG